MKVTDYDFYIKMIELQNRLETNLAKLEKQGKIPNAIDDIQYAGTIDWIEIDSITNSEIPVYKEIYISIEKKSNGNIITKYYDENMSEPIAIDFHDSNGIVATKSSIAYSLLKTEDGKDFKSQFENIKVRKPLSLKELVNDISALSRESGMSKEQILSILKEKDDELEKISRVSGTSKEDILSISNIDDTDKSLKSDEKGKIILDNKQKPSLDDNANNSEIKKDNPNIKQETDLNQKVNNRFTLGDVLGVPEDGKLVVVYSSAVKDNTSTTKFTFLIQEKDGNFKPCDNLELVGGTRPANDVYASNYDGSNVEKDHVNSEYIVKGPLANKRFVLTANTGSFGTIDLGIGQAPKLQGVNEAPIVTTPLKTTSTYNTHSETKETLHSYNSGMYSADDRGKEASSHTEDCKLTEQNVDGNTNTGHQHESDFSHIDTRLSELYDEKGCNEYFTFESFRSDFFKTYLNGNESPTESEFENACKRYENEHSLTRDDEHGVRRIY